MINVNGNNINHKGVIDMHDKGARSDFSIKFTSQFKIHIYLKFGKIAVNLAASPFARE